MDTSTVNAATPHCKRVKGRLVPYVDDISANSTSAIACAFSLSLMKGPTIGSSMHKFMCAEPGALNAVRPFLLPCSRNVCKCIVLHTCTLCFLNSAFDVHQLSAQKTAAAVTSSLHQICLRVRLLLPTSCSWLDQRVCVHSASKDVLGSGTSMEIQTSSLDFSTLPAQSYEGCRGSRGAKS